MKRKIEQFNEFIRRLFPLDEQQAITISGNQVYNITF
jgi:hypothetical protein